MFDKTDQKCSHCDMQTLTHTDIHTQTHIAPPSDCLRDVTTKKIY